MRINAILHRESLAVFVRQTLKFDHLVTLLRVNFSQGVTVVTPLETVDITKVDCLVVVASAVLFAVSGIGGKISRLSGIFMLLSFIAYNVWLVMA